MRKSAAEVTSSAILLVVLSKGYLKSEWCDRELKLFLDEEARRRSESPSAARVFVIETDRVEIPDPLEDVIRQRFWVEHPDDPGETKLLGYPRPDHRDPDHKPFYARLNSLVCDLAEALEVREYAAVQATGHRLPCTGDGRPRGGIPGGPWLSSTAGISCRPGSRLPQG